MVAQIKKALLNLVGREERRLRIQYISTYVVFFVVAVFMTVLNAIQNKGSLTYATGAVAFLCIVNVIITNSSKEGEQIAAFMFAVEIMAAFTFFLVSGNPDGFSAIWLLMMPMCSLLLFRFKIGSIISATMFAILVFFFYFPTGQQLLQYDYNATFMMRFPIVYVAVYCITVMFELVRDATYQKYEHTITHDSLTKALNRNGMDIEIHKNYDTSLKSQTLGFMIFDIDHFKIVNDTYGHLVGDDVLKQVVHAAKDILGFEICRWGGEEFSVVDYEHKLTREVVANFVREMEEAVIDVDGIRIPITISAGCVQINPIEISLTEMYRMADECLYEAKNAGRNRSVYRELRHRV